jgi:hypothetical protein
VKLVMVRTEAGVRLVVENVVSRRGGRGGESQNPHFCQKRAEPSTSAGQDVGHAGNNGSLDYAESSAVANDSASLGMTGYGGEMEAKEMLIVPWIFAMADPAEKWWERMRGNPKRLGEVSQAAFLLRAEMMGFGLSLPWGDSERYDFVVLGNDGRALRVQVKGTGRLHRRGYEVQPVRSTRGRRKKRYTKKDIDVLAAHVQPVDVWYLIPIEEVGRAKSLRFYPDIRARRPMWEEWRDRWKVLGEPWRRG